jgi:hypothetical protein
VNLQLSRDYARWYDLNNIPIYNSLVNDDVRFKLVPAGRRCLHPDTKIWTEYGLKRISEITSPIRVLSWNEKSQKFQLSLSGGSFPKGMESLYRTVTTRGEFVSTLHHQIFSSGDRYRSVSQISESKLAQTASISLLHSISGLDQLSSVLDVQNYSQKDEDCLRDYADEARLYGQQLLKVLDVDKSSSPLLGDVQEPYQHYGLLHNERKGGLFQRSLKHIHQGLLSFRLSNLGFLAHVGDMVAASAGRILTSPLGRILFYPLRAMQSLSILESHCNIEQHFSVSRSLLTPVKVLRVVGVEPSPYYDMQVLDTNNYVCEAGFIHHNSGKTEKAKRVLAKAALSNPNQVYFAAAPTHTQAKKIWWKDLKQLTLSSTHIKKPSESELIINLPNGSEIHVIGLDVPSRIEGVFWTGGVIDEIADIKPEAWESNIRPALDTFNPLKPDYLAWCWLIGVPDGLNHYYDMCQYALSANDPDWKMYHWKSSEVLPKAVIESAKRSMSAKQFKQEYEASFETATGRIYDDYSEDNYTDETIKSHEQLLWYHDFNYTPMSNGIGVRREDNIFMLDEIILTSAVARQSALEFVERYKDHKNKNVIIYGDPAGRAGEKHGHASDYTDMEDILRQNNWKFTRRVKKKAPAIKDRQNAVRAKVKNASGKVSLFVNTIKCPYTHKGLSTVQFKKGSSFLEEETDYQHITTAFGYMIDYEYPINIVSVDLKVAFAR